MRPAILRSMLWMAAAGLTLSVMNAIMRLMTQQLDPLQAQFLRYALGVVVMLPIILRGPIGRLRPNNLTTHVWRNLAHTSALSLFFLALPHIPLADVTAIMFVTPVFVLLGATLFLKEKVTVARWLAAIVGFLGVVVVLWPHFSGDDGAGLWGLVMLAATPLFAASFLIAKALTRFDNPDTIVAWQNLMVALFAMPMAIAAWQWPNNMQWLLLLGCGLLGTIAHWCFTTAFSMADISALQPVRFLDLLWSSLLGLIIFGNSPALTALAGGIVIVAATAWLARHESRSANKSAA